MTNALHYFVVINWEEKIIHGFYQIISVEKFVDGLIKTNTSFPRVGHLAMFWAPILEMANLQAVVFQDF
jgi:hypothetical protein